METIACIANGQIDSLESIRSSLSSHSRIAAVDGGLIYCRELSIRPDIIIGDFDSCPESLLKEYKGVPVVRLDRDKDETDLEFAVKEEMKRGPKKITLFGAWGRRIDHSLGNLFLLTRYPGKVWIETEGELLFAIDKSIQLRCFKGQTLSLIPLHGPAHGIRTKNLKWELTNKTMDQNFIGISNICLEEEVEISLKSGSLVVSLLKEKIQD